MRGLRGAGGGDAFLAVDEMVVYILLQGVGGARLEVKLW